MIKNPSGGAADDAATPVEQDGFYRFDKVPVWTGPCGTWACTQFTGSGYYSLDYKLPAGMTGRYKLQWYWMTGGCRPAAERSAALPTATAIATTTTGTCQNVLHGPTGERPHCAAGPPQATAATPPARTMPPTAETPSTTQPAALPAPRASPTR
jgi:hypothetical protein